MTKDAYIEYCKGLENAVTDCPFENDYDTVAARHSRTGKWFALVMKWQGRDIVNLKCEPMEAEFLRKTFEGVIPAYHMNKRHWNTVFLESDVPDREIMRLTRESFLLTGKKAVDKKRL